MEYVQIDYNYLMIKYIPIEKNKGKVLMAISIDMKLAMIPLWVVEFVSKKFCMNFFEVIMKVTKNYPGSKWEEKAKRHPDVHNFFKKAITDYYEKKGIK